METGYAVLSKYTFNKGYVLFLYKKHLTELHQIPIKERQEFLLEMSQVAEATLKATNADKMNYELLGNTEPHLHWHLIPRYKTESDPSNPIWIIDKKIRQGEEYSSDSKEMQTLKEKILENLQ